MLLCAQHNMFAMGHSQEQGGFMDKGTTPDGRRHRHRPSFAVSGL